MQEIQNKVKIVINMEDIKSKIIDYSTNPLCTTKWQTA